MNWRDVPLPERMQALEKDQRGLPIPFIVQRDAQTGRPYFTINNEAKVEACRKHDLCAICGHKLLRGRWFVGGPASAFHENGCYIDTPTHDDCCHHALRVCPYLAAPKYTGRLDDQLFDYEANPGVLALTNPTMIPERPRLFVALMAVGQKIIKAGPGRVYVKPLQPYRKIEYWRAGERVPDDEGYVITADVLAGIEQKTLQRLKVTVGKYQ